jgi:hypothetical protein
VAIHGRRPGIPWSRRRHERHAGCVHGADHHGHAVSTRLVRPAVWRAPERRHRSARDFQPDPAAASVRRETRGVARRAMRRRVPSILALIAMSEMRGEHESVRARAEATTFSVLSATFEAPIPRGRSSLRDSCPQWLLVANGVEQRLDPADRYVRRIQMDFVVSVLDGHMHHVSRQPRELGLEALRVLTAKIVK